MQLVLNLNVEMIQLLVSPEDTVRFDENLPSLVPIPSASLGTGVARCYITMETNLPNTKGIQS